MRVCIGGAEASKRVCSTWAAQRQANECARGWRRGKQMSAHVGGAEESQQRATRRQNKRGRCAFGGRLAQCAICNDKSHTRMSKNLRTLILPARIQHPQLITPDPYALPKLSDVPIPL
eukprot:3323086-Rhodomonas_salina.3